MHSLAIALVILVLGAPAVALAQPAAEPAQPAPDPNAPVAQPATTAAPAADPAERLTDHYDRAFAALAAGRFDEAIADFDEVATRSSDPELRAAARELGRLARDLRDRRVTFSIVAPGGAAPLSTRPRSDDDKPNAGRTEVVGTTTMASFYAGFALLSVLDVDDFRGGALIVTATTGAGFLTSLLATRERDISSGMSAAYGSGVVIGAANGLLLAHPIGLESTDQILSLGLGGLVLGGAAGLYLGDRARPTVAQSRFGSTLGLLGLASAGLGLAVVQPDVDSPDPILLALVGGLDLGAGLGIAAAPRIDWSRSRSNLVVLSSFLGAVGGFGVAAIITGEPETDDEGRVLAAATLIGMWGGLGTGYLATDDMAPDPRFAVEAEPSTTVIAPTRLGDDGYGMAFAGAF